MDMKLVLSVVLLGLVSIACGRKHVSQRTEDNIHGDVFHDPKSKRSHHGWDYLGNGPSTWADKCKGSQQSPINIVTANVVAPKGDEIAKKTVTKHNYNTYYPGEYTMLNNGHALQINFPANTPYRLTKGGKVYTPLQVHIHFNPFTNKGSEHTLNSKKYFAEIHIVHAKSSYIPGKEYMNHDDGLLVIGMFVDRLQDSNDDVDDEIDNYIKRFDDTVERSSFAMRMFGRVAKHCSEPGMKRTFRGFKLGWLFPSAARQGATYQYVNYHGSLTTPPCSEIVDWIVATGKVLKIDRDTADIFKEVTNSLHKKMGGDGGNNRPVQPLNGRKVYGIKKDFF